MGALRRVASAVGAGQRASRFEAALHAFAADLSASATCPRGIEAALLHLARRITRDARVELIRTTGERAGVVDGDASGGVGPGARMGGWSGEDFRLRCGAADHGVLRLDYPGRGPRRAERDAIGRRLVLACTLAACALEGARLQSEWVWDEDVEEPRMPSPRRPGLVRDATFLNAVLPFALEQSRRHGEPMSLICVQVDRLAAIRDLLGPEIADGIVSDLGAVVGSMIRASDLVARLDDDRIVALLIRARGDDALRVAGTIRRAVAASGLGAPRLPGTTVSMGVAEFPAVARDAASLLEAADEAMAAARAAGLDEPVLAGRRPADGPPRPHVHAGAIARSPELSACA